MRALTGRLTTSESAELVTICGTYCGASGSREANGACQGTVRNSAFRRSGRYAICKVVVGRRCRMRALTGRLTTSESAELVTICGTYCGASGSREANGACQGTVRNSAFRRSGCYAICKVV